MRLGHFFFACVNISLLSHTLPRVCVCVRACVRAFQQAEGILRAWATPALKEQYGNDPVVTKIWNTTMTEVRTDWNRLHVAHTHRTVSLL